MDTQTEDYKDIELTIRRRGRNTPVLLKYPAWDINEKSQLCFRFDSKIRKLVPGRYEMEIFDACVSCERIELVVTPRCRVSGEGLSAVVASPYEAVTEPPAGVTNMYQTVTGFSRHTCAIFEVDATKLPLCAADMLALCNAVASLCRPVELLIEDGVNTEVVELSSCTSGQAYVRRGRAGTRPARFPKGATVRFVWTEQNVLNAMAGCP